MNSEATFLRCLLSDLQEVQKRNHPDSAAWIAASKEIHAAAKRLVEIGKGGAL